MSLTWRFGTISGAIHDCWNWPRLMSRQSNESNGAHCQIEVRDNHNGQPVFIKRVLSRIFRQKSTHEMSEQRSMHQRPPAKNANPPIPILKRDRKWVQAKIDARRPRSHRANHANRVHHHAFFHLVDDRRSKSCHATM